MSETNAYSYFQNSARNFHNHTALYSHGVGYSYAQLEQRVNRLASLLMKVPEKTIGLFAHRNITSYTAILAILKSGKAYVPLNPKHPASRNEMIRETAGCRTVVTDHEDVSALNEFLDTSGEKIHLVFPDTPSNGNGSIRSGGRHEFIYQDQIFVANGLEQPVTQPPGPYAYILFTSGSTGRPKGVPVPHSSLCSFVERINRLYDYKETDRFSQSFSLSFDPSIQDMFSAWSNGASLYNLPETNGFLPASFISDHALTVWHSVPSIIRVMNMYRMLRPGMFPNLRYSLFGGEALHVDLAEKWSRAAPESLIDNLYGPTEATITISQYRWNPKRKKTAPKSRNGIMSVGKIFPGHRYQLLAESGSETDEERGELLLQGEQVFDSYLNNEEANRKQFLNENSSRWYRTGDIMEMDSEGDLYFISRRDDQIKIRGNRIDIGEVRHAVESLTKDHECLLLPYPRRGYTERLLLFIRDTVQQTDAELITFLKSKLPDYMIPRSVYRLSQFPLNSHGKTDTDALYQLNENGGEQKSKGIEELRTVTDRLDKLILKIADRKSFEIRKEELEEEFNLYSSGLLDSFDLYEFLLTLEDEFMVELDISELNPEDFTRYGNLVALLLEAIRRDVPSEQKDSS